MKAHFVVFAALALMGNTFKERAWALMENGKEAEALAVIQQGVAQNDPQSLDYSAWLYDEGRVVEENRDRSIQLYRRAADAGEPHAQWRLGVMIDEGVAPGNKSDAIELFRRSAAQGFTNAMTSLGVMYAQGSGVERDYGETFRYYEMAAKSGNPHAVRGIGLLYLNGEGVPVDAVEAAAHFVLAHTLGNPSAQTSLDIAASRLDDEDVLTVGSRATELARLYGYDFSEAAD